jgi:hypothetical protein
LWWSSRSPLTRGREEEEVERGEEEEGMEEANKKVAV